MPGFLCTRVYSTADMKRRLLFSYAFFLGLLVLSRSLIMAQSNIPYPWAPDRGDGTYRNPIICADYSDPDVIRDGEDFWLVASSFTCTRGRPILHPRDWVNRTSDISPLKTRPNPRH